MSRNSLTLSVYAPTLILAFCSGMLAPILPLYARSFHVSYALVGLVLASQGIGNLVGDIPAGILLGKIGHKRSMLAGIAALAVSMLATSQAHSALEVMGYAFIAGVGMALWNISRHAYITDSTATARRGRAIAVFGGVNRIGSFAGPAVGGAIATTFGLRAPFVVFAAVAMLALIFPALFAVEIGDGVRHRGGLRGHTNHLFTLLRTNYRTLSTAGAGQLLAQMIRAGRQSVVPLYAADVIGLDVQMIGWIASLSSAIDMSMFYPAGYIMDHFGRKYAYVPCFAIQAVGMAIIPFTDSFAGLLTATLIIGLGNGLGSGTMMTLGADLAPRESRGEFLGVWRLIGDAGQTGSPMIVGSVADLVGLSPAAFVIAGVGLAAALILGLLVPETLSSPMVVAEVKT